jgi:hypothetical protein
MMSMLRTSGLSHPSNADDVVLSTLAIAATRIAEGITPRVRIYRIASGVPVALMEALRSDMPISAKWMAIRAARLFGQSSGSAAGALACGLDAAAVIGISR